MHDEVIVFDFRMRTQNALQEAMLAQERVESLHFLIVRGCRLQLDWYLKEIKEKMAFLSWKSRKPESGKKFFK